MSERTESSAAHTARSLELRDRISIEIRRMWDRSTARNMPLTITRTRRNTQHWNARSAIDWRLATSTAWQNAQKPQDR